MPGKMTIILAVLLVAWLGVAKPLATPQAFAAETSVEKSATPATAPDTVEERRLLYTLSQERARLQADYQQRNKQLDEREINLKTLATEVDKKLAELEKLQSRLAELLKQKDAEEAKRLKGLSRMYEKMDAAQAAKLLADLDQQLAVDILSGMQPKAGAKILNNLPPETATRLSVVYSKLDTH